jgi:hypothetical protein
MPREFGRSVTLTLAAAGLAGSSVAAAGDPADRFAELVLAWRTDTDATTTVSAADYATSQNRHLAIPVLGARPQNLRDTFAMANSTTRRWTLWRIAIHRSSQRTMVR